MRSLSGSTEGPQEAVTPRVSEVSEPILVLDEDAELELQPREPLEVEDKIPPVPPIPAELRSQAHNVKAVDVVVEVSVPEEEDGGPDDAPADEASVADEPAFPAIPKVAVGTAPSTESGSDAGEDDNSVTEGDTVSIAVTEDAPDTDEERPPTPPTKDTAHQSPPKTPEPDAISSLNTTPKTSATLDPPLALRRDSPTTSERVLKTPTPASPFPPSRTRTPTATAKPHTSPTPPVTTISLPSPSKPHLGAGSSSSVLAHNNSRSPRSSLYTASNSPISVISRVASESGSLRSLNSGWHPAHAFDPPKRPLVVVAAAPPLPEVPDDDANKPFDGAGVSLHIGVPCIVTLSSRRARFRANVKYLGRMKGHRGAWVGLEVDDLERLGVDTLPTGARDGVRYFHFTPPPPESGSSAERAERARKLALIAEEMAREGRGEPLRPRPARVPSNQLGLGGLGLRAASPFAVPDWGPPERPRALFVRPSEVLFVMGSD